MTSRAPKNGPEGPGKGKSYWRSLDRRSAALPVLNRANGASSPTSLTPKKDEFAAGCSDPPRGVSRRAMLGLMGASFAMVGLAGCRRPVEKIVPYVNAPEDIIPGIPQHFATTLPIGTSAYGIVVESHEGRPGKIEGNELHPSTRGAANAWIQASVLGLYDPDRSSRPQRRGGGESAQPEPATWDDFLAFWNELTATSPTGAGVAVLSESFSSPTRARLAAAFRQRFPDARWVVWDPVGDENVFRGLELATGQAMRPVYHFDKARTVLALDSDFLHTDSEAVSHARGFASSRRVASEEDGMSRLYAVESTVSITGAAADHRLPLASRSIPAFVAALIHELHELGVAIPIVGPGKSIVAALPPQVGAKAKVIAADLATAGASAAVIAGPGHSAEVHAAVYAINSGLGAVGETVTLHQLEDAEWSDPRGLVGLAAAAGNGEIETLILLGGNPVYSAPADLGLGELLPKIAHTVHLSSHLDETSSLCEWHLPCSHFLEAWGDARSADGTASVIQPLIAPLLDTRSEVEVLAMLSAGEAAPGYGEVQATWREMLGGADFEGTWKRVLHDGLLKEAPPPATSPESLGAAGLAAAGRALVETGATLDQSLELVFAASASVFDGRFANLTWLQEMPDPITKITWDNAALISPATADALGLGDGEVAVLKLGERRIEAPVWKLPGQAEGSVALALGYGRTAAGRAGDGVGVSAYPLRTSGAGGFATGLEIEATGREHPLVQTQEHGSLEGRPLIREASLEEYRAHPEFASEPDAELHLESLWEERPYDSGYQWGMSIDLNTCIGCNACLVACQSENNIPVVGKEQVSRNREMHWIRVDRYFAGNEADPEVVFQPVPCQHCENAPCEQVCPVAATVHSAEGINSMIYNRCIGTRYCSNNCPYKVRRFNFFNYTKDTPELLKMAMNPDVTVRSRGVMEKCTFCIQRINAARIPAKREGREIADGEIRTACQQSCPSGAIVFGNLTDPESAVSKAKGQNRDYVMLAELNNKPRTSYLAKIRNPNPEWGMA